MNELRAALYSLLYLVFLTKKMERGSGDKYFKTQRIIYAFTVYVLGLAAITGFLFMADILGEYMQIVHIMAGVLVILVAVHRVALVIRKHDKVALRSVLATGTMPMWYVRKNHKVWYEQIVGRGASEFETPVDAKKTKKSPVKKSEYAQATTSVVSAEERACIIEDKGKDVEKGEVSQP